MPVNMMNPASQKQKYFLTGTFVTGTGAGAGWGCVSLAPSLLANNNGAANRAIVCTTSSSTETTVPINSGVAGQVGFNFATPYASTSLAAGALEYRVVAAGLRAVNVTAQMYKEGTFFGLCEPNHAGLSGFTGTTFMTYEEGALGSAEKNDWFTVIYNGPVEPADFEYSPTQQSAVTGRNMAIIIQASNVAQPQTIRWEAVVHVEWVGSLANGKSPTYADPQAVGVVSTSLRIAQATSDSKHHSTPGFFSALSGAIQKGISMISPLGKAIASLPGPAMLAKGGALAIQAYSGGARSLPAAASVKAVRPKALPQIAAKRTR